MRAKWYMYVRGFYRHLCADLWHQQHNEVYCLNPSGRLVVALLVTLACLPSGECSGQAPRRNTATQTRSGVKAKTDKAKPEKPRDSSATPAQDNSDDVNKWMSGQTGSGRKTEEHHDTTSSSTPEEEYAKLLKPDTTADLRVIADATIKLRRQITDDPADPFLHYQLGTQLLLLGDLQGAATELTTTINANASSASARAQLGKVLELTGDHMDALRQFRRAVELAPNAADVHYLFGESLMHSGNPTEATNEFRRAVGLKQSPETLAALSEALLSNGDAQGAMTAARQAVSLDGTLSRAQIALTNALLRNGDKQSALRTARQATLLSPNLPESHLALGRCLFQSGQLDEAVDEFKQAVALDPLSANARNDLGYALYKKGALVPALAEFRLCLRINPRFTEARNNLEVAMHGLHKGK